jgi:hypothetical protein
VTCCLKIIEICERVNIWENDDTSFYQQATFDLEVEKVPELVEYLCKIELVPAIDRFFQVHYNQSINSFDDVFVVKYHTSGDASKSELAEHTDAGEFSFMIALSDYETDYAGGGTYFRVTDRVLHLSRGSIVTFDGSLYHRGEKITSGTRYLLVGFCYTDPCMDPFFDLKNVKKGSIDRDTQPSVRGNLSKDLQLLY